MWKTRKQLIRQKQSYNQKQGIIFDNKLITDSKLISDEFNTYFVESIEQISAIIIPDKTHIETLETIEISNCTMDNFKQLEMRQLRKHVKQLKNKQSSVDGINMKILKSSYQSIGDRYLQLINNSLNTGTFPQN